MILQNNYWFDILPSRRSESGIEGKWLHFGPTHELHSWLPHLDRLVEEGQLAEAKMARKLTEFDPFPNKDCVLAVFTSNDRIAKDGARDVLKREFGIEVSVWKSDAQTHRDWQPGGWLALEAEFNRLRARLEREGLGNSEKARLRELADHLRRSIDDITEPSRIAEVALAKTTQLVRQLSGDLRSDDASLPHVLSRLDAIQAQIKELIAKGQTSAPEPAVATVTEAPNEIFVIMPFARQRVDTYDAICRGVGKAAADLRVQRADEMRRGAVQITDEIRKAIRRARLIVCDLSDERPNVYYELGLAHGLMKKVICIASEGTVIHFDVYGLRILFFDTFRSLEEQVDAEVRAILLEP